MSDTKRRGIPATFDVYDGDEFIRRAMFTQASVRIGRDRTSDLRLEDESVSRMHAAVEFWGPGVVEVMDVGSATGIFLNGTEVSREMLRSGDTLTLGRFRVVVRFDEDVAAAREWTDPPQQVTFGPDAFPDAPPPLQAHHERSLAQSMGLHVVRPGTALVLSSRSSGEVRAVRTSGMVFAWPGLRTVTEVDLTPLEVHATASGEGAALTADGLRVPITLKITVRPRGNDAVVRELLDTFGLPPEDSQVASRLVEALTSVLAATVAELPRAALRPAVSLGVPRTHALGHDLEHVEVLNVGDAVPDPVGYRGGQSDLRGVRFEGTPVSRPTRVGKPSKARKPVGKSPFRGQMWDESDTSQRVVIGWFILLGGLPLAVLMATAHRAGVDWMVGVLFLLGLCGLANSLAHLRSWWTAPPAIVAVVSCIRAANALTDPLVSVVGKDVGFGDPSFSSTTGLVLFACLLWLPVVLLFASNTPGGRRGR